jgi:hypothetical protein
MTVENGKKPRVSAPFHWNALSGTASRKDVERSFLSIGVPMERNDVENRSQQAI